MCSTLIMEGAEVVQNSSTSNNSHQMSSYKESLNHQDNSPSLSSPNSMNHESSDDDISVGCPSPALSCGVNPNEKRYSPLRESNHYQSRSSSPFSQNRDNNLRDTSDNDDSRTYDGDDYFKPLKKLKMMQINKEIAAAAQQNIKVTPPVVEIPTVFHNNSQNGVKSFSILDILNHRPDRGSERANSEPNAAQSRIVRPWDLGTTNGSTLLHHRYHHRIRPKSADFCYTSETLSSSSGRSSAGGSIASSDCCTSPDIINCTINSPTTSNPGLRHHAVSHQHQQQQHHQQHRRHMGHQPARTGASGKATAASAGGKGTNTSPLDALFQMTSKTFDELNGEAVAESQANHLNLFNNRQSAKKKRKSRTAFTNHQIFELEKRFLYQKYLSPADRDEIAGSLGLSNAQVITWFQNRRAKLKRDLEELKKDVESVKVLTAHKSFLENVQDLGILKKKAPTNAMLDEEKRIAEMTLSLAVTGDKNL